MKGLKFFLLLSVLAGFLASCAPDGAKLFQKEGCINCHRYKGVGGSICPDLTDVTKRKSEAWIRQQIKDPTVNNPNSKMPRFGHLSDKEIDAIISYLKS
jgi:cbb3-type cytochrome oxidase cytochrome c subunit